MSFVGTLIIRPKVPCVGLVGILVGKKPVRHPRHPSLYTADMIITCNAYLLP